MINNFKENLRSELNYQGLSVKELSARTGIPVASLDCYLGTRATMPSAQAAVKIAIALQVSVEYLVIGENTAKTSRKKLSREAMELIRLIEILDQEKCKAILNLMKTFQYKSQLTFKTASETDP